jgi:hypothetical protein
MVYDGKSPTRMDDLGYHHFTFILVGYFIYAIQSH